MIVNIFDQTGNLQRQMHFVDEPSADDWVSRLELYSGWYCVKDDSKDLSREALKAFDKSKAKDPEIAGAIDALITYLGLK